MLECYIITTPTEIIIVFLLCISIDHADDGGRLRRHVWAAEDQEMEGGEEASPGPWSRLQPGLEHHWMHSGDVTLLRHTGLSPDWIRAMYWRSAPVILTRTRPLSIQNILFSSTSWWMDKLIFHILLIWHHLSIFCSPSWQKHLAGKQYQTDDEVISAA